MPNISPPPPAAPLREEEIRPADSRAMRERAFANDIERLLARRAEFVAVSCPACDARDATPAFEKHGISYVSCRRCRTLYATPRPSEAVLAAYYADSENYRVWATHIFPRSEAARREKIHRPALERVQALCRRWGGLGGHLVEIGPGFGTFAALAAAEGGFARVTAIEPTPELAAACRSRGVTVVEKRVEDVGVDDVASADVLVAFEVIEHLFDPARFLAQCRRALGDGGLLILSCPNGLGFDVSLLGARSSAVDPEHINLFNPDAMERLLERSGFKVVETMTPGRLDAELARQAVLDDQLDLGDDAFLRRVLIDDWDRLGARFQAFLADAGLSSHMWVAAVSMAARK